LVDAWEGFSPAALAAFLQDFGEPLRPDGLMTLSDSDGKTGRTPESSGTPLFWKWAGWKNREVLKRLEEVVGRVREHYPGLDLIRIIPASAVLQPQIALARSGLDLLEEKQHGFDYFATAFPGDRTQDGPFELLNRLIDLIGDPKRVIALVPSVDEHWAASHLTEFQGAGLMFLEAGKEPNAPLTRRRQ
jgi:hypothetical protein